MAVIQPKIADKKKEPVAFEISKVRYQGDRFSLTARVRYETEQEQLKLVCRCVDQNGRLVANDTAAKQNSTGAEVELTCKIPGEGSDLRLDLEAGIKKPLMYSRALVFPHPKDMLIVRVQIPERVTNGAPESDYPDNYAYASQQGGCVLDVFAPVEVTVLPDPKYLLKSLSGLRLTLEGPGGEFRHCAPEKRLSITMKDGAATIRFPAEWKNRIPADGTQARYRTGFSFDAEIEISPTSKTESGCRAIHWDSKAVTPLAETCIVWEPED